MKLLNRQFSVTQIVAFGLVAALVLFSFTLRLLFLGHDLPYYAIDENDIVEPALAFVAGDLDPRWYKYGPLFSYSLALLYAGQHWLLTTFFGWTSDQFFYSAFFDSSIFYFIARSFHFVVIISAIVLAVKFCWRYYDRKTAFVVLVFGIAPVFETITAYTIRVDTLQGVLALACLYFSVNFNTDDKLLKTYILAGIFAGLVFATKPLTGLLLLPAVAMAHMFTCPWTKPLNIKYIVQKLFVENKGIYVFAITLIITHSIVHPYSVINFSQFWQEQYHVIFNQSDQGGSMPGYSFAWVFDRWGVLLALLALLSPVLLFWQRDRYSCVLMTYVLTFIFAFVFFKTRVYWYSSIAPVLLILMARLLVAGFELLLAKIKFSRIDKQELILVLAILFVMPPLINMWNYISDIRVTSRADQAAQNWIEMNLKSGSRILAVGWYASTLPRVRSSNVKIDSRWAEHFMYQRNKNQAWVDKYLVAHNQLRNSSKPTFDILNIRKHYHGNYQQEVLGELKVKDLFTSHLPDLAKQNHAKYIVTASPTNFKGDWEKDKSVELLASFSRDNDYRGAEVKIFLVR